MRALFFLTLFAAVVAPLAAAATDSTPEPGARTFAIDRYRDARTLIEGPRPAANAPVADPAAGCVALYQRRIALQGRLDDRNPAYWDDPRNQSAVFLGTVWTPAFYFLGYSAVTTRLDELSDTPPRLEIDALRQASAALRCFEK